MKRIAITGDMGFIGTHLTKRLSKDFEVKGIDIKRSITEDIRDKYAMDIIFERFRPEIVIHLAALTGVRTSMEYPAEYYSTNILGTDNLVSVAEKHGVEKFLFASSSSIYGDRGHEPRTEDMEYEKVLSPYPLSKIAGELICKMPRDMQSFIFRPFTVYGEGGRDEMVVKKIIRAGIEGTTFYKYGEGNSKRGYTNVHDLVGGIVLLSNYELQRGSYDIFNLGGSEVITLNELVKIVKEEFPNLKVEQIKRHSADILCSYADITKAESLLGWKPKHNFRDEIKRLCQETKK